MEEKELNNRIGEIIDRIRENTEEYAKIGKGISDESIEKTDKLIKDLSEDSGISKKDLEMIYIPKEQYKSIIDLTSNIIKEPTIPEKYRKIMESNIEILKKARVKMEEHIELGLFTEVGKGIKK